MNVGAKHFKVGDHLFHLDDIRQINISELEDLIIHVRLAEYLWIKVEGLEAIELIMAVKPSAFEGKRLKFPRRKWIMHNIVAHPLMQILALVGLTKWGLWVHDATVPKPLGIKL